MPAAKQLRRWAGFHSILCAVDFSDHSRRALLYAEAIARRGFGALHVVYANDPLLIAAAAAALRDRGVARRSRAELQTFVEGVLSVDSQKTLRIKVHAAVGHARDVILKTASRTRAQLIVVGTQGLTGADRVVMGSTTMAVLQRSGVPVLAVPGRNPHAASPEPSWPGPEIVAALELDAASADEADHASHIAEWFGASLRLVHVVDRLAPPLWLEADLTSVEKARTARAQKQIEKLAVAVRKRVNTTTRILHGNAADELAAFADKSDTGLIVTALRERDGWFGARRGSISYHMLTRATVPVLAYPPRWRPR